MRGKQRLERGKDPETMEDPLCAQPTNHLNSRTSVQSGFYHLAWPWVLKAQGYTHLEGTSDFR